MNSNSVIDTNPLPFELKEESITRWIDQISQLEKIQSANILYDLIKQLKLNSCALSSLYMIVDMVTPKAIQLSSYFDIYLSSQKELSDKKKKVGKLGVHLLRSLINAYFEIVSSEEFSSQFQRETQALIINRAISLIGLTAKSLAMINAPPSGSLCQIQGKLFQYGLKNELLETRTQEKIAFFKQQPSILSSIKRSLLFSIINPHQFNEDDLMALFQFIMLHGDLIDTCSCDDVLEKTFYWNFHSGELPNANADNCDPNTHLLFSVDRFFRCFEDENQKSGGTGISPDAVYRVLLILSQYDQPYNSIIPAAVKTADVILGFGPCLEFMKKQSALTKIQKISNLEDSELRDKLLSVLPLEHEQKFAHHALQAAAKKINHSFKKCLLLTTKDSAYFVIETKLKNSAANDFIIVADNGRIGLGIVRKVKKADQVKSHRMLVEKLPGEISFIEFLQEGERESGLLQTIDGETRRIYLSANRKRSKTPFQIIDGMLPKKDWNLERLSESTNHFRRYEISPC
ncbi:MAG: hypothetical protein ACU833_10130 [Gammaproteobacteria bacterium]